MINKTNPILAIRQLLKYSQTVKDFLQYTKNNLKFDWERTITERPNNFVFSNLDFVRENIDGSPWFHIVVTKSSVDIICRDDSTDEYYTNHIVYGSDVKIKKYLNTIQPLYIISSNYINFIELPKKQYSYIDDYIQYKYEIAKTKRYEKCIELQIFKIFNTLCENLIEQYDITYYTLKDINKNSELYHKILVDKINQLLQLPQFIKWTYPIKQFDIKITDFEIDYTRQRCYIENIINYTYIKNNTQLKSKYNMIFPSHYKFKRMLFSDNIFDIFKATLFDNILQLINVFHHAIKNNDIALIINNTCNNGFNNNGFYNNGFNIEYYNYRSKLQKLLNHH